MPWICVVISFIFWRSHIIETLSKTFEIENILKIVLSIKRYDKVRIFHVEYAHSTFNLFINLQNTKFFINILGIPDTTNQISPIIMTMFHQAWKRNSWSKMIFHESKNFIMQQSSIYIYIYFENMNINHNINHNQCQAQ